ncbi:MAG: DUF373 family protein [Candidatus Altiarchaeota archaeon]|nr:DUF373 family protein [Candidatus Altiarchaeota archaeon]
MKTLVLCIDRDDDIGRNTKIKGPIVGWDSNLDVAQKMALADPQDTDVNALFGALNIARKLGLEVVTLTGDANVGLISDRVVAEQLDEVIKRFSPESVIVVTDGLDDQQVLPIIQSRVKIESVQTIVVRQSKELEKAYFKIIHFMKEITDDPTLARLLFGIPGIALILLAFGGIQALSIIMAVIGVYLIAKGFGLEEDIFEKASEFFGSLSVERISTMIYVVSFMILVVGTGYGYSDLQKSTLAFSDMNSTLNSLSVFILNSYSMDLLVLTILVAIFGRIVDDYANKKYIHIRRYLIILAFIVMTRYVLNSGANFIVNEGYSFGNFILTLTIGIVAFALWIKITDYMFMDEIETIKEIMRNYEGKDVYNPEGKRIGRVSKVIVRGMEMVALKVGHKRISKDSIVSSGDKVVVNLG